MKKIFKLLLTIIMLVVCAFSICACDATEDIREAVNPIKLSDSMRCEGTTIKASASSYVITPAGFDYDELNKRGYRMTIRVSYDVYYTKDWDVLWDIGYLGAPKYEVCILDDDLVGKMNSDVVAPSSTKNRSIAYTTDVVNLIGSKVYLTFSSDNIQNKIHFKNINIVFECFK